MKKDFILEAKTGTGIDYRRVVDGVPTLRGEFHHYDLTKGPTLTYRQIRLGIRRVPDDDALVAVMIRPDSTHGILVFDVAQLLSNVHGFILHGIHAVNDRGGFVLTGANDSGLINLPISTNPENMNLRPMPGLLVTEVRLPLDDNDWSRS